MPAFRRKSYKRRSVSRKRTYKRKSYAKRSPMKKMVRREIRRAQETKTSEYYNAGLGLWSSVDGNFSSNNIFPVHVDGANLQVPQGTGQGGRIGNEITIKKLTFSGHIVPEIYNAVYNPTPAPVHVKMWIFYDKANNISIPAPITNFFQSGSASRGFQNDLMDHMSPPNADRYAVLATKTMKVGFADNTGTGSVGAQAYFANNDYKMTASFRFDLTKHIPKLCRFNDGTNTPTTRGLYCMIQPVYAIGTAIPAGIRTAVVQYVRTVDYTDA